MTDCPMNGTNAPAECPACGRAKGGGCARAEAGPWPEAAPPVDPLAAAVAAMIEARDFLDVRARMHRCQSRASRTWRKDYEATEAEKFEAHSDKLTKAILAAKGEG